MLYVNNQTDAMLALPSEENAVVNGYSVQLVSFACSKTR